MDNPGRRTDDRQKTTFIPEFSQVFFNTDRRFRSRYEIFRRGGEGSDRLVILCLGLLNAILLIAAVAIGINCAKVKEGSLQVTHSAATKLINELNYLRSNHSDVIKAEEEAKNALERAIQNHAELKVKIEQHKTINDEYHRKIEALQTEKTILQSNISALEGTCGRCLSTWILLNSSCYFFSYTESSTVKKNWPNSRADCISRGADLIVIDNQEEQKFVSDSIENMRSGRDVWQSGFWIGLTDTETEGTWVWINNVTEVEQRYWMDGEPNNVGHLGEDCGIAVYSSDNPWKTRFDANCHQRERHWICEMTSIYVYAQYDILETYQTGCDNNLKDTHLKLDDTERISNEMIKLQDNYKAAIKNMTGYKKQLDNDGCRHCPPGWILMNSLCYYFSFSDYAGLKTWQKARDFCQMHGGDLAVIDTKDKEQIISSGQTHQAALIITVKMEGFENSDRTFDGRPTYKALISQEDLSGDEHHLYPNQEKQQVSMSMVRPGSSLNHYKVLTVSLAVLATILLAVDIGMGIYYSKLTVGQNAVTDISSEMAKLQAIYNTAIQRRDEIKNQLAREISGQQLTKWELEHQKRRSKDYEKRIDKIRMEIAALKSHMPMMKEGCRHCLPGWTYMNSVCYFFAFSDALSRRSWQEARQFCMRQGGDIAVIDSREKHLAISDLINNYQDPSRPTVYSGFWIGLRDVEEEGTWKWLDGTRLNEGYWNDGEPNNQGNEDCAATYPKINPFKAWNDAPCNHELKWICEITPRSAS
ncbi:uncharacterized protein LOC119910830 [Micropterus salmoides]|uniref:uncharacterized protein LOC119910830 n=1 Tax=Micropterus salmoides TaxID=27706 RepID=UPI0018EBDF7E|nr:uncharacterized protein LOC119910830 [Micropterus salmoides]